MCEKLRFFSNTAFCEIYEILTLVSMYDLKTAFSAQNPVLQGLVFSSEDGVTDKQEKEV